MRQSCLRNGRLKTHCGGQGLAEVAKAGGLLEALGMSSLPRLTNEGLARCIPLLVHLEVSAGYCGTLSLPCPPSPPPLPSVVLLLSPPGSLRDDQERGGWCGRSSRWLTLP